MSNKRHRKNSKSYEDELIETFSQTLENIYINRLFNYIIKNRDLKLLELLTRHRGFFYLHGFERKILLIDAPKNINKENLQEAIELINNFYREKLEKEEREEKIVSVFMQKSIDFTATILSIIVKYTLEQSDIQKMIKQNNEINIEILKEKIEELLFDEKLMSISKEIDKSLYKLIEEHPEYIFSLIFPVAIASILDKIIEKVNKYSKYSETFETLEKLGAIYPLLTIYICDNVDSHTYDNPSFLLIVPPHLRILKKFDNNLVCPYCNSKLKGFRLYSFVPPIPKIMFEHKTLHYFIAYYLQKQGYNIRPHVVGKEEIDLLVINEKNEAIAIELKQYNELEDPLRIGQNHLKKLLDQLRDRIGKKIRIKDEELEKEIEIIGAIGITNHNHQQIENALSTYEKAKEIITQNRNIRILSFEGYEDLPRIINSLLLK